jgi:hypothetical protein
MKYVKWPKIKSFFSRKQDSQIGQRHVIRKRDIKRSVNVRDPLDRWWWL